MIKKVLCAAVILILTAFSGKINYKDGSYRGVSRSVYTSEPYFGKVNLVIEKGKIINVEFVIRDSTNHENFDGSYEQHFAGNDQYIQQCRNDWRGVQTYPKRLLKCQDPEKLDAISGATWSYNIFRASVVQALAEAGK